MDAFQNPMTEFWPPKVKMKIGDIKVLPTQWFPGTYKEILNDQKFGNETEAFCIKVWVCGMECKPVRHNDDEDRYKY